MGSDRHSRDLAGRLRRLRSVVLRSTSAHSTEDHRWVDADLRSTRIMRFRPVIAHDRCNPMVEAARRLLLGDSRSRTAAREVLADYYRRIVPRSLLEWTGIPVANEQVARSAARDVPMPWIDRSLEEHASMARRVAYRELARGDIAEATIRAEVFWNVIGPLDDDEIEFELERIASLTESMKKSGYQRPRTRDQDILAWHFVDGSVGQWWSIAAGNHRVAVAAAVGLTALPIRVLGTVERDATESLPGVLRGYFTPDEARDLFDLVSGRRSLPEASSWTSPR